MKIYFYERLDSDDCFKEIPDFTENYVIDFFSEPLPSLKSDSRYFLHDCDAYRFIGVASSECEFLALINSLDSRYDEEYAHCLLKVIRSKYQKELQW